MSSSRDGCLQGKAILVTGAGRGIGAASAELFAREGASVMLLSRTESDLQHVVKMIHAGGGEAEYVVGSVEDRAALERAADRMMVSFGRFDGAFNNAGSAIPPAGLIDISELDFDAVCSMNLRAVWSAMRVEILAIRESSGTGAIVNNSSVGSFYGNAGRGAYSAAKRAVNSLTATAAVEHGPEGIRVNAIAPGMTMTPMAREWAERDPSLVADMNARTPLRRGAEPSEVAEAAAWLLSDRSMYVTGIVMPVDGGLRA